MSDRSTTRAQRVGQLIREMLAQLLLENVDDPRIGFLTVTEVRPSADLKYAHVYVSVLGPPQSRQASVEAITEIAGFLKTQVGQRLSLRYTPHLTFHLDETLDHAERIEALVQAAGQGQSEPPELPVTKRRSR